MSHGFRLGEAGEPDLLAFEIAKTRGARFGPSMSTPVTSVRPVSKISASSMRSAQFPVKVSGAGASA